MTDETMGGGTGRSLVQRALDLAVFAPAGALLALVEDAPGLAEKGRTEIEGQLRNARAVGQLVVTMGRREVERRVRRPPSGRDGPSGPTRPSPSGGPDGPSGTSTPVPEPAPSPGPASEPLLTSVPPLAAEGAQGSLAIPDYDNLSASQVVRRLDGLAPAELEAVARHEAATRGRRTILHRVQQLLIEPGAAS